MVTGDWYWADMAAVALKSSGEPVPKTMEISIRISNQLKVKIGKWN